MIGVAQSEWQLDCGRQYNIRECHEEYAYATTYAYCRLSTIHNASHINNGTYICVMYRVVILYEVIYIS